MAKDLKRIKTTYRSEVLDVINALDTGEFDVPFSIKVEKLILIALAYQPHWETDDVFTLIKPE